MHRIAVVVEVGQWQTSQPMAERGRLDGPSWASRPPARVGEGMPAARRWPTPTTITPSRALVPPCPSCRFRPLGYTQGRETGTLPAGAKILVRKGQRLSAWSARLDAILVPQKQGCSVHEVTRILSAIEQGDPLAAEQLLPLVYDELRRLAAEKMAREKPGRTLQATALVHEAYIRLVDTEKAQHWNSRGHFFAAAAEAMRRILVERARRKGAIKHGGGCVAIDLDEALAAVDSRADEVLVLDEAVEELGCHNPEAAQLVKLRFFAGLTHQEAAQALGIGRREADRLWALARAWLYRQIGDE